MTYREYLEKLCRDSIGELNAALAALARDDVMGAGICMGRAEVNLYRAPDTTVPMLDKELGEA